MSGVIAKYNPTKHAVDRARLRFGIESGKVVEWIDGLMRKATYISSTGKNGLMYEADDIRLVIDAVTSEVITIHSAIKTDFLRPTLEREMRKLRREHTRNKRTMELLYAEALQEFAEMAVNRAKARNPQTRELISGRMSDKQAEIDDYVAHIQRLEDEYESKVRAIELISE